MIKKPLFMFMALLALLFVTACGQITEYNEVTLVIKTIGDRSDTAKDAKPKGEKVSVDEDDDMLNNFTSELITAKRAPMARPGIVILKFPLGLQAYEFSSRPSIENPENEAITAPAVGGTVTFDTIFHMYIDRTFPDLKLRLLRFVKAYQLRQYDGANDVLAKLMSGRLKEELFKPFIEYCANRRPLKLMRSKDEMNIFVLNELNTKFNKYGLRFALAAASSAVTIPDDQQIKLNEMVTEDAKLQAAEFRNKHIKPLDEEIARLKQEGETEKQQLINVARAEGIKLVTTAEKERRTNFITLIGEKNYVALEEMLTMVKNMKQGKTRVTIIPEDARIYLGTKSVAATE